MVLKTSEYNYKMTRVSLLMIVFKINMFVNTIYILKKLLI